MLMSMFMPWAIWVTVSLFATDKAMAVQTNKFDTILEKIEDLKTTFKDSIIKR